MSAKEIHLDESARRAFLSGVERHSTSVKTAFGPSGRVEIVAKKFRTDMKRNNASPNQPQDAITSRLNMVKSHSRGAG